MENLFFNFRQNALSYQDNFFHYKVRSTFFFLLIKDFYYLFNFTK